MPYTATRASPLRASLLERRRYFFALQALVWVTYGAVHFAASLPAISPDERVAIGIAKAIRALTGFMITCGLWPLVRSRVNPESARWWITIAIGAIAAGFAWMFIDRVVLVTFASVVRLSIPWDRFPRGLDLDYFFVMIAWTAGAAGLLLAERNRVQREEILRNEVEHQATRLRLLASQLNPHFLFNSLNTIKSLAAEDSERAREVVSRLSSFLRRVIALDSAAPATVKEEIELARDYLHVEEARFESGLLCSFNVAPDAENVLLPPLILQPLLENAIRHGEADSDGLRKLEVSARIMCDALVMEVSNTGRIDSQMAEGVGLRLTRSRLEEMYGPRQLLEVARGQGMVTVSIVIDPPMRP